MIVRVKVSSTYSEVKFDFDDFETAFTFTQLITAHGYRDTTTREPLEATITVIQEGDL